MNVNQLINRLKEFPDDARIYTDDPYADLVELGAVFIISSRKNKYDGQVYLHFNHVEEDVK